MSIRIPIRSKYNTDEEYENGKITWLLQRAKNNEEVRMIRSKRKECILKLREAVTMMRQFCNEQELNKEQITSCIDGMNRTLNELSTV